MNILYWNIRGIANTPSRVALKKLLKSSKLGFLFIAEPWISFDRFPQNWLFRLGYKLFACNTRPNNIPNLWCICSSNIDPVIVSSTDQQVSLTFNFNSITFGISAVYASTCYIHRRTLWSDLINCHTQFDIPWCTIGDFNAIIRAHEHRGFSPPAALPMAEFLEWSNNDNFIHLPTRGVQFTWANGREGRRYTEKRLDRALCNNLLLDVCTSISVTTMLKLQSDHFPILVTFQTNEVSVPHQFKFLKMWILHEECKNIIASSWRENVVGCSMFVLSQKLKSLKIKLKTWNKNVFGNVQDMVKNAEATLQQIQAQIDTLGHTYNLLNQQKAA